MYKIKNLNFSYRKDQSEKTLKDVTFNIPNGCLNVLVKQFLNIYLQKLYIYQSFIEKFTNKDEH